MHRIRARPADTMQGASTVRSGDLMGFGVAVTPVFGGDLGRHLLGELRELLGLRGHRLELLACMRGRQVNELRRGLHPQQFIGVVKGGVSICTRRSR